MSEAQATTILSRRFPAKRAFITGAASGLGRAMAAELASDGWQLGLLDLSTTRLGEAEAALRGAYVADLGPIIDRFFAEHTVEALTVTPADFRTSIERAVAAAGSGA